MYIYISIILPNKKEMSSMKEFSLSCKGIIMHGHTKVRYE